MIKENYNERQQLSEMLKRMRAYAGVSQRQLSEKTGICQSDISKIERGIANPSLNTVSRLAQAMGTKLVIDFYVDDLKETIETEPLNSGIIEKCSAEAATLALIAMDNDVDRVVLYGSCARGDYTDDSDIDIAIFTKCDRLEAKKYSKRLADAATILMSHYKQIVNYVCLPISEFNEKKEWYPFFKNIENEGVLLYGQE